MTLPDPDRIELIALRAEVERLKAQATELRECLRIAWEHLDCGPGDCELGYQDNPTRKRLLRAMGEA